MGMYDQLTGMEEILDDFAVETNELIEALNEDLLTLENNRDDIDQVNRIFRAFHTIKGTCGFLNFTTCGELSHASENILNRTRNGELEPTPAIIDVLLEAVDWIKEFVIDVENRVEREYDITDLVESIEVVQVKAQADSASDPAGPITSAGLPMELPDELVDEFIAEGEELLEFLDNDLLTLKLDWDDEEYINGIFRAFHTMKGNSGLMGLADMNTIAHGSENVLGAIREKSLKPNADIVDALLQAVDFVRMVLDEVKERNVTSHNILELDNRLRRILGREEKQAAVKKDRSKLKTIQKETTAKREAKPTKRIDQTIRVDVKRLDNMMNLAGELVLEKNRLVQVTQDMNRIASGAKEMSDLDSLNNSLGMVTTEIQESVMKMRMLPISHVFRKFPRLIRDLSREKNKQIELELSGEETELDRSVIESIGDPFVHLLRNAVDHGIEEPDRRARMGKPRTGTISLSAYQEGNNIVIEIEDDGAGIDPQRVAAKALEKNVISDEDALRMTDRELINLIFKPGFSTAKVVTDVSGRGVGMDVVHSNISKLNGTVDIKSNIGKGTTFTVKLPLTLTIQSGMVVKVWHEQYIIPLTNIMETIKLDDDILFAIKGHQVIRLRGAVLPIVRLDDLLHVSTEEKASAEYVVVVSVAEKQMGLVVTDLVGQEETVVKPLGHSMGKVPFIAGATIRGDGHISLIIDVPEILDELNSDGKLNK